MSRPAQARRRWKERFKPWAPPALIDIYRRATNPQHPVLLYRKYGRFTLPVRPLAELFPGIETRTTQIPVSQLRRHDQCAVPAAELLTLAAICGYVKPRCILEIGTYTGSSALIMAMNTPPETEIFTLDLDPTDRATHQHGLGVGGLPDYTVGAAYLGTPFAGKIRQLLGSSLTFDFTPFTGNIDLVFIDADHTYDFVKADTATALKLLRPGGIILWDDYVWDERFPECAGVTRCVNELAQARPIARPEGTRFAIYVDKEH